MKTLKKKTWTAKEIVDYRRKLGLTQVDFATHLDVTYWSVIKWEEGKRAPSRLAQSMFTARYQLDFPD